MKRGRTFLIVMLICALLATGIVQSLAQQQRGRLLKGSAGQSSSSLANMDSFALALLLGGLRGPLVMFLWMQSEATKSSKNLEGIETQIEWIRLLQPEFDTVHMFQIWNKAYNISAQIVGWAGKYLAIVDALDYAHTIDRQRPDDVNMISAMGGICNDKLGGSQEKPYFDRRVRAETKWRADDPPRLAGARPTRFPSMLNEDGTIRSQYIQPRLPVPATTGTGIPAGYDGSELQFLKRYEPFPYGIPARALGYNYLKRSQVLQATTGQEHLQVGAIVVDSRPALTLRQWSEDEWNRAVAAEGRLMGIALPTDRFDALIADAKANPLKLTAEQIKAHEADLREAICDYTLSLTLMQDSIAEFRRHLANPQYQMHVAMYQSHLDHLEGVSLLVQGDLDMLKAVTASAAEKQRLLSDCREQYTKAMRAFRITRLRFYSDPRAYMALLPPGTHPSAIDKMSDAQLELFVQAVIKYSKDKGFDQYEDDIHEYDTYSRHAQMRMQMLGS